MENERYPFVNTPLPYAFDALEPFVDQKTMELHHDRHLQTYIDNLNAVLAAQPQLQELSLVGLIQTAPDQPSAVAVPLWRNAGGVYNHRFFFEGMANPAPPLSDGALSRAIDRQFGGMENFWWQFRAAALAVFGSGYAWLVSDERGRLHILTTANQDSPVAEGWCPVLTVDVWEHAYYLKHYNQRAAYLDDFRQVIDWAMAERRYSGEMDSE